MIQMIAQANEALGAGNYDACEAILKRKLTLEEISAKRISFESDMRQSAENPNSTMILPETSRGNPTPMQVYNTQKPGRFGNLNQYDHTAPSDTLDEYIYWMKNYEKGGIQAAGPPPDYDYNNPAKPRSKNTYEVNPDGSVHKFYDVNGNYVPNPFHATVTPTPPPPPPPSPAPNDLGSSAPTPGPSSNNPSASASTSSSSRSRTSASASSSGGSRWWPFGASASANEEGGDQGEMGPQEEDPNFIPAVVNPELVDFGNNKTAQNTSDALMALGPIDTPEKGQASVGFLKKFVKGGLGSQGPDIRTLGGVGSAIHSTRKSSSDVAKRCGATTACWGCRTGSSGLVVGGGTIKTGCGR